MRVDSGWVGWTGDGELIEACAVLADTEEVGGPVENIDRLGVLNKEGWLIDGVGGLTWVGLETWVGEARSSSGAELVWYLGGGRGEKMDSSAGPGEGVFLADVDAGNEQVGS